MKNLSTQLRNLEDILFQNGAFTYCYNSEDKIDNQKSSIGDPSILLVIHSDKEMPKIRKILNDNKSEIIRLFGKDVEISFQFLVYFLTYLEFGEYTRSHENVYLSTTFKNIKTPEKITTQNGEAIAFDLKVVGIIEGSTTKDFETIRDDIKNMAEIFNDVSRYIKLRNFDYGTLTSRLQPAGHTPTFTQVNLGLGI